MEQGDQPQRVSASDVSRGQFRYFDYVMVAFVVVLLLSNMIGAAKRSELDLPVVGTWSFGAGIFFFPVSYIVGDVLTEVYGYARARRVIWSGFAALLFMAFMAWVVVALPPAASWDGQPAYEAVFGSTWRIVAASMVAFFVGEFANAQVLARMKVWTGGRFLWMRTIASTLVGQAFDSVLFYPLAFAGSPGWTSDQLVQVVVSQFMLKTLWEALLTPATYGVVGFLKRREGVDVFDDRTRFTPFDAKV